jgi:hypothetical protein
VVLSGTPASSTTKADRHDIAEILLKVALNTKKIKSVPGTHEFTSVFSVVQGRNNEDDKRNTFEIICDKDIQYWITQ